MPMKTISQALDIRSLILQNIEAADVTDSEIERKRLLNFVIAGAGTTGVELAGALAEFRRGILKFDYPDLDENEITLDEIENDDIFIDDYNDEVVLEERDTLQEIELPDLDDIIIDDRLDDFINGSLTFFSISFELKEFIIIFLSSTGILFRISLLYLSFRFASTTAITFLYLNVLRPVIIS